MHNKKAFIFLISLFLMISPVVAIAQTGGTGLGAPTGGTGIGTPTGGTGNGCNSTFCLQNPLGSLSDFCDLLKAIFNILVIFAIPIAVVMVVFAGFKFVLARGNPTGLEAAKKNLIWTLIGIALFFGAWFLAQVIANTLIQLGGNSFNSCF